MFQNQFKTVALLSLLTAAWAWPQLPDSTAALFATERVSTYTLTFYETNWHTQLTTLYSEGEGRYLPAHFDDGTLVLDSVGVRYKGNSTYTAIGNSPKKPLKIKFDEFRSEQTYFGTATLNFSNGYGDPTFMREWIGYQIAAQILPSPRANFANIRIADPQSPATLLGFYTQVEQVNKSFLRRHFADTSGNLYKAGDNGASLLWEGDSAPAYYDNLELKTNGKANDWSGMLAFLDFLNNSTDSVFCSEHTQYFNATNLTRFLAFPMVLASFDSYIGSGRNYYMLQQSPGGMFTFLPWDLNMTYGTYSNGWDVRWQSAIEVSNLRTRPLLRRVLDCPDLHNRYLGEIRSLIVGPASVDSLESRIHRMAPVLRPHVDADPNKFYRIGAFDTNLTEVYRASSTELIPGLLELARTRNPELLLETQTYLPIDYVLEIRGLNGPRAPTFPTALNTPRPHFDLLGRPQAPPFTPTTEESP